MSDIDILPYQTNKDLLHQALIDSGSTHQNNKYTCPSPGHEDKKPSASIYDKDGKYKWHCHACGAGGDIFDIMAIMQQTTPDRIIAELKKGNVPAPKAVAKKKEEPKKVYPSLDKLVETAEYVLKGKCTARHEYTNPDTRQVELVMVRVEIPNAGKEFWACHPVPNGWSTGYPQDPRPIYNRSRVARVKSVFVVEGEKCVEHLQQVGIVATTSPGGANAAHKYDWSPLAGKTVYIWRDNDPPNERGEIAGLKYQNAVIDQLIKLQPLPDIRVIDIAGTGLGPKQDAADFVIRERANKIPDELIKRQIEDLMAEARPEGGSQGLYNHFQDIISGRITIIDWEGEMLSNLTLALQPGTVTIFCGDPGSAKSFFLLQQLFHWHINDVPVAVMELEDDRTQHLKRALVQLTGNKKLFEFHWIKRQGETATAQYFEHKALLDSFSASIYDDPDANHTLDTLAAWVQEQCAKGVRVIVIDPITLAESGREPWISERKFMVDIKRSLRASGSSCILVSHPKKGRQNTINMDQLSGSTNYPRFSHTVFWLEHHKDDVEVDIITYEEVFGARKEVRLYGVKSNKTIHICKTRLGCGHGYKLAYKMESAMRMNELGLIAKSADRKN